MGGSEHYYHNNTNIVGAMKDALLCLYGKNDSQADDYQRNSIIRAKDAVEVFANTMYSKWLGVRAYALALEDDGWNLDYIEDSFSYVEDASTAEQNVPCGGSISYKEA
jgi:hypothetical protein